jgi:hypothetical protein
MNDKELADRVVALGVGMRQDSEIGPIYRYYYEIPGDSIGPLDLHDEKSFVVDWRVAGALMEKWPLLWYGPGILADLGKFVAIAMNDKHDNIAEAHNESLPRAIIEACVEALDKDDD